MGTPTSGHQCYRQMTVDRDYCFDPNTQKNCDQIPQPLLNGRTVFFAVQPKYLNVNIRITIDVTMGVADIFLSNEKDTFQVFLDRSQFLHEIYLDKLYVSNHGGHARRSAHKPQIPISSGKLAAAATSVEDIIVNDEAVGDTIYESESVKITQEVPEFLKLHSSDSDFYKMSQFESVEEVEKEEVGEEQNKKIVDDGPQIEVGRGEAMESMKRKWMKKYSSGDGLSIPMEESHVTKIVKDLSQKLEGLKKQRKKKKKEEYRMEKHRKKSGVPVLKHGVQDGLELLYKIQNAEWVDNPEKLSRELMAVWKHMNTSSTWQRRHRRELHHISRLLHHWKIDVATLHHGKAVPSKSGSRKSDSEDSLTGKDMLQSLVKDRHTSSRQSGKSNQPEVVVKDVRERRSLTVTDTKPDDKSNKPSDKGVRMGEIKAGALNTYITVSKRNSVLAVRDVRFRLVIMLPRDQHDLKSSRFYMIVRSRGGSAKNATFSNLYFRQDQPHIDLFVFFSVFFSCFFLFLSVCVMLWKLKQTFDARRSRQMREREMECMASRPFARILALLEPDGTPTQIITSSTVFPRRCRLTRVGQGRGGQVYTLTNNDLNTTMSAILPLHALRELGVVPIAIEPTDDGLAAISTVVFQLPGGPTAPARLCLGSSLTTRLVTSSHTYKSGNVRRRTSASSC